MAFLGFCAGLLKCLGGAAAIMSSFKTTKASMIIGGGSSQGFEELYTSSSVFKNNIKAYLVPKYIERRIKFMMTEQSPEVSAHMNEIIESLRDAVEFGSYAIEDHRMVNSVSYNDRKGKLYMYIYTFTGYMNDNNEHFVKCEDICISINFKLPRDWIIVAKVKANFFKCSMCQELQFLPEKSITMAHVVEAISIALAPAVLGLIKVPDAFMKAMEAAYRTQIENPNGDVRPAPNPELAAQSLQLMQQMEENQKQNVEAIKQKLGSLANSDENAIQHRMKVPHRHHHHRMGIPEHRRYRHHLPYDMA